MSNVKIALTADWASTTELRDQIRRELADAAADVRWQAPVTVAGSRGLATDPAVLVAVVAATSTVVSALIGGLFRLLAKKGAGDVPIIIKGSNGASVQIPPDRSPEELAAYIEVLKTLDEPRIHLESLHRQ